MNKQYSVKITFSEEEYEILKQRAKDKKRSIKSQLEYDVLTHISQERAYEDHMNGKV